METGNSSPPLRVDTRKSQSRVSAGRPLLHISVSNARTTINVIHLQGITYNTRHHFPHPVISVAVPAADRDFQSTHTLFVVNGSPAARCPTLHVVCPPRNPLSTGFEQLGPKCKSSRQIQASCDVGVTGVIWIAEQRRAAAIWSTWERMHDRRYQRKSSASRCMLG